MFGFAKNQQDDIDDRDLGNLRDAARFYNGLSEKELDEAVAGSKPIEVDCDA